MNDERDGVLKTGTRLLVLYRGGCKRGIKMQSIASVCTAVVKNSKIWEAGNKSLVRT